VLIAGTKLGPYEIVAPLGSGGMGEVYRARDPRLGREVAIKVVPESFASDPNRLRTQGTGARSEVLSVRYEGLLPAIPGRTDGISNGL
jgi:serine/threonine protein kinase